MMNSFRYKFFIQPALKEKTMSFAFLLALINDFDAGNFF